MSEAVSAMQGAQFEGIAKIRDLGPRGMITLRGDLTSAPIKKAVKAITGTSVPGQREVVHSGGNSAAWMSPDELLLVMPYGDVTAAIETGTKALGKAHSMLVEVSDARANFAIEGAKSREVLAKLLPVDLSPETFTEGMIRRSHTAQVPAALWMTGPESFELVCFRSVAAYVFGILSAAACEGSQVDIY